MENIIITKNLSFKFGNNKILDNLNLRVKKGSIYGFLGANGAGKTTTIKILSSLYNIEKDKVFILNKDLKNNRDYILKRMSSFIETPSLYHHLSAYDNLLVAVKLLGIKKERIEYVLKIVKLENDKNKIVKDFSLGMKQRLGIALILLQDSELLILDEPTNGLDPKGVIDIRELIINLNQNYNKTVFVSSHNLNEIEKIATDIGIIKKGKLLFQGEITSLNKKKYIYVNFRVNNISLALSLLKEMKIIISLIKDDGIMIQCNNKQEIANVNKYLINNNIDVYSIQKETNDLEHLFLNITK